jgi:hypothetical protein
MTDIVPGASGQETRSVAGPGLIFGIYPGMTGAEEANVDVPIPHHDDPAKTKAALRSLGAAGGPLLVRGYLIYKGGDRAASASPVDPSIYADAGRKLDVVLCYRSPDGDLAAWSGYVRRMVALFGPIADAIQVTEEPNNPRAETGGDGSSPDFRQAMIIGVIAAKEEAVARGLPVRVGVAFTPSFHPADDFWPDVGRRIGPEFLAALDYVGLDFFPDVFRPVPFEQIGEAVEGVLVHFRSTNLRTGVIPESVPIRITENGWPTGEGRPPDRQAEILDRVVRTIYRLRTALNITHYEFFMLRNGDSSRPEMGYQWGLLRHDYTPKPAFEVYRHLIAELGRHSPA